MRIVLLAAVLTAGLSACTTREALRADVRQQRAECQAAQAYGTNVDRRVECRDLRQSRRALQRDRRR